MAATDLILDETTGIHRFPDREDDPEVGDPVVWVVTLPGGKAAHDRVVGDHCRVMAGGSLVVLDSLGAIIRAYSPAAWISVSRS